MNAIGLPSEIEARARAVTSAAEAFLSRPHVV